MLITTNLTFADWNEVFPDNAMMIAAVDRLVHHSATFKPKRFAETIVIAVRSIQIVALHS
jgi:DNA replication protein DnaC